MLLAQNLSGGLCLSRTFPHGLRGGLHSYAAPRLDAGFALLRLLIAFSLRP
jgi:hypothetical protein